MKQFLKQWIGVIFAVASFAAPAPYPLTINSRSQTAPPVTAYRGNEMTYRVSFVDGSTSSAIADDETPFMSWATNASAGVIGTSIYSRVSGQTGVVDFTFSPSVLNYDQGRYIYEAGVISSNGNYMVYRQGTFSIYASPVGGGANPFIGTANIIWGMYNWIGIPDWITADDLPDYSDMTAHIEDTANPHDVTAAQIGAATIGELADVEAALAGYQSSAYWPPNATARDWFTFTTNSGAITITGYNIDGGTDVVIPDYINGLPVTRIGGNGFSPSNAGMAITSVVAQRVTTIGEFAFYACSILTSVSAPQATTIGEIAFAACGNLTSISLPQATAVGDYAFADCGRLTSISLPQATTISDSAFVNCSALTSVSLPQATAIGSYTFAECVLLTSVHMGQNAPAEATNVFANINPPPTVYVTNPQATGWGEKLGDMPVVRMPLYGDKIYQAGELVATTGHVAQAIAAIPEPDLSGKLDASGGTASNLTVTGFIALPQTAATNLVLRMWASNDVIYASEVYQ